MVYARRRRDKRRRLGLYVAPIESSRGKKEIPRASGRWRRESVSAIADGIRESDTHVPAERNASAERFSEFVKESRRRSPEPNPALPSNVPRRPNIHRIR